MDAAPAPAPAPGPAQHAFGDPYVRRDGKGKGKGKGKNTRETQDKGKRRARSTSKTSVSTPSNSPRLAGVSAAFVGAGAGAGALGDAHAGPSSERLDDDDEEEERGEEADHTPAPVHSAGHPLVFQCKGCRSIVGDSLAWIVAKQDMRLVVLSDVTGNVAIRSSQRLTTSTEEGPDLGSTFATLECAQCETTLGRKYRTTAQELDELRDAYSLTVDALTFYQLGSGSSSSSGSVPAQPDRIGMSNYAYAGPYSIPSHPAPAFGDAVDTTPLLTSAHMQATANENGKIRLLLMAMGERLQNVERYLALGHPPAHSHTHPPPSQQTQTQTQSGERGNYDHDHIFNHDSLARHLRMAVDTRLERERERGRDLANANVNANPNERGSGRDQNRDLDLDLESGRSELHSHSHLDPTRARVPGKRRRTDEVESVAGSAAGAGSGGGTADWF